MGAGDRRSVPSARVRVRAGWNRPGIPGGFPAGLLMDGDGTLWVKTWTGPLLFLPRGHTKFQVSKYGEGISSGYAYLREGPDGTIWLSDGQGLRQVASKL